MQKHVKDQSLISRPINEEAQVSTKPRWLHFSSFGCTLLIVLTVLISITQLTHTQNTYAVVLKKGATATSTTTLKAKGKATLKDDNGTLTFSVKIDTSGLPNNTAIVAHVHDGSCTGTILFALGPGNIDNSGQVSFSQKFTQEKTGKPVDQTMPNNWFFNFHDANVINPADGKPFSLGCKEFNVTSQQKKATADVSNHTITLPS